MKPDVLTILSMIITAIFFSAGCTQTDPLPEQEISPVQTPSLEASPSPTTSSTLETTTSPKAQVLPTKTLISEAIQNEEDWTISEYSGSRTEHDLRVALASKGFAWLSGSPADNEKLSIGKNAQFFGFVALRYESGRAANRGALGRAFFTITEPEQQVFLREAVLAEAQPLDDWWETRETMLTLFEEHLYIGEPIDKEKAAAIGAELSVFNATVAIHEARAFATLENALNDQQQSQISTWREDPEQAYDLAQGNRLTAEGLERDQLKQLEDLYAKAFSWITGTAADNEIIPLGQPAQFFGFVSIRHKSGHAASRGDIAKSFLGMLNPEQLEMIDTAVAEQMPVVQEFLQVRHLFLQEMMYLRTEPDSFDYDRAIELAVDMGALEAEVGWIEAQTYRKIRQTMTDDQISQMMDLRGDYILDESQVELLSFEERGEQLSILCSGCHGEQGQHQLDMIGPTLDGIFDRPIASAEGYEYSEALQSFTDGGPWTLEKMDQFLAAPQAFAPGTKMGFQGLLNNEDREALIHYLQQTR